MSWFEDEDIECEAYSPEQEDERIWRGDTRIELGRSGEHGARKVTFDLSEFAQFGEGTFTLIHQRSCDFAPYICTNIEYKGNTLDWFVNEQDTAAEGIGQAEIQMFRGEELLAKSPSYMTFVEASLGDTVPPEAYTQIIIDQISAIALSAQTAADEARASAEEADAKAQVAIHPPIIGENDNWWLWDGGEYVDSGFTAVGAPAAISGASASVETLPTGSPATVSVTSDGLPSNRSFAFAFGIPKGDTGSQGPQGPDGVIRDLNSGEAIRLWFGTLEEYNALEEIYDDVYYNIKEEVT